MHGLEQNITPLKFQCALHQSPSKGQAPDPRGDDGAFLSGLSRAWHANEPKPSATPPSLGSGHGLFEHISCESVYITWTESTPAPYTLVLVPGNAIQEPYIEILGNFTGTSTHWLVDIPQQYYVFLQMNDDKGSFMDGTAFTVQNSSDTSCLGTNPGYIGEEPGLPPPGGSGTVSSSYAVSSSSLPQTGSSFLPSSTSSSPSSAGTSQTSSTPSSSTASSTASSGGPSSMSGGGMLSSKTSVGAIAGGVIGGVVVLALIVGLIFFFMRRNRRNRERENKVDLDPDPPMDQAAFMPTPYFASAPPPQYTPPETQGNQEIARPSGKGGLGRTQGRAENSQGVGSSSRGL